MAFLVEVVILPFMLLLKLFVSFPLLIWAMFKKRTKVPPIDDKLLLIPAHVLVKKIIRKEISCETVIKTYIARIEKVNPIINAVVQNRFGAAVEEAKAVDRLIYENDPNYLEAAFPLLGLPLTVKESIMVKGMSNTAGCTYAAGKIANKDADIVVAAKRAGAIIVAVTNTPELCMNWESFNCLTGTTNNPYDTRRTSGGSSGGEAALIASGASLLGLGSDIAGSLRLPAHNCGIFSHKPTARAVSINGHYPDCGDVEKWKDFFILGPMTRYASDLMLLYKTLVVPELTEHLQLNKEVEMNKLKIYYMKRIGGILNCSVDKEILNAMKNAMSQLSNTYGVQIKEIDFKYFKNSNQYALIPMLGITKVEDFFYNRPKTSVFLELLKCMFYKNKPSLTAIMFYAANKFLNNFISAEKFANASESSELVCRKLEDILNDDSVLICPTYPTVANFHGTSLGKAFECTYCSIFNTFGLPSTNAHVGFNSDGLPIGIQIVAKRNCDRLTISVAQEIENICGGWRL